MSVGCPTPPMAASSAMSVLVFLSVHAPLVCSTEDKETMQINFAAFMQILGLVLSVVVMIVVGNRCTRWKRRSNSPAGFLM